MHLSTTTHPRKKNGSRTAQASKDPYVHLNVKLYRYLARRTDSKFNEIVLQRMYQSRSNRRPMSISRIAGQMKNKADDYVAVLIGSVLNDERLENVPKMNICALRFTKDARARIEAAGGSCLTFDQLAMLRPTGSKTVLLRGRRNNREAVKHFGPAPGLPGSHTKPYTPKIHNGLRRKFERGRGRRQSRGFKN